MKYSPPDYPEQETNNQAGSAQSQESNNNHE